MRHSNPERRTETCGSVLPSGALDQNALAFGPGRADNGPVDRDAAMLRLLLMLAVLLTYPHKLAHELRYDPRNPFADPVFTGALRVAGAVRQRFSVAAEAAGCRAPDNLYGYELLLSRFSGEQQQPIRLAAREGADDGASRAASRATLPAALPGSGVVDCAAVLKRLRAADDQLMVLAERDEAVP